MNKREEQDLIIRAAHAADDMAAHHGKYDGLGQSSSFRLGFVKGVEWKERDTKRLARACKIMMERLIKNCWCNDVRLGDKCTDCDALEAAKKELE